MTANIITLSHRADRHTLIVKELVEQKIEAKFWWGEVAEFRVENGISRAHKNIIRHAKYQTNEEILVMEDDIKFTHPNSFKYFLDNKPADFDIYLASVYVGDIDENNLVKDFAGLTMYIVHPRFFDTFLNVREDMDLDRALAGLGKYVVCNPFVAVQHDTYSDHHKAVLNLGLYMKDKKLYNG